MNTTGSLTLLAEAPSTDATLEHLFLARQPILDRRQKLVGYELLFRSYDTDRAEFTEHMRATSTVVHNAFIGMGLAVLGHAHGYINVDVRFLLSDLVEVLPPEQAVLEILESVEPTSELILRVRELKRWGYSFALDDYAGDSGKVKLLLNEVDIVKVDLLCVDASSLAEIANDLRRRRLRLLAEKVETREQFELACGLGFDLFQGYHFARPQVLTSKQLKNPGKVRLLRLLSLALGDADADVLDAEIKLHPTLSYNLLRMVNAAAGGLQGRVNSLRHAIIVLGRRQLQVRIQLLLYTARDGAAGNPLLQMAAARGKLMESLARADPRFTREDHNAAFMTGILSLVDVVLEMSWEEILDELPLAGEVKQALLYRVGALGHLLHVVEKLEDCSAAQIHEVLSMVPDLPLQDLLQIQLDALLWAISIEQEAA